MSDTKKAMDNVGKNIVLYIETIIQGVPLIYSIAFLVWYAYNENNDSSDQASDPTDTWWWSNDPNIYTYIWHGMYLFVAMLSFLKVRRIGPAYDTKELKNVMTVYLITVVVTWITIFYIKYLKQKLSDTFSNLSNASASTYESVSSIGSEVTDKLRAYTSVTEGAFCSDLIVGDTLYDMINSIPVPNDIVDGFDFLNIDNETIDLNIDLRDPIKTAISPLNASVVGLKTLVLLIVKAVIALINVMTKIGLLGAHVFPSAMISLSDFARLCDKHGVVLAVLYTCTLLFGKTFVILVNAMFVFTPLVLALYVLFSLFEIIIYFFNPFEGPMGQLVIGFIIGLGNYDLLSNFSFFLVLMLMFACIGCTVWSHIEHEINDYNERVKDK